MNGNKSYHIGDIISNYDLQLRLANSGGKPIKNIHIRKNMFDKAVERGLYSEKPQLRKKNLSGHAAQNHPNITLQCKCRGVFENS